MPLHSCRTLSSWRLYVQRAYASRDTVGSSVSPETDAERELLGLWQELLGIDGLGVEDDFFASGGTSLLAARLFARIARRFGVRLPLTTILELPTIRTLARRIEQQGSSKLGSLVALKRGGSRNLFLVHDGDGETLLYLNLAERVPRDLAVWGIEPRRLSGIPLGHASIEDMATFYLDEVRKRQPHGPYLLGGMCAGGVIAYAMAERLESLGEKVDLVALLDAAAPGAAKKPGRITKDRLGRLQEAIGQSRSAGYGPIEKSVLVLGAVSQKLYNALSWELGQRAKRLSVKMRFRLLRKVLAGKAAWPRAVPELSVRQIYDTAEALYRPNLLSVTPTVLVRASNGQGNDTPYQEIYADKAFGWEGLARKLTIVDVDGGHASMLQADRVDSLAGALQPYLTANSAPSLHAREAEARVA